MWQWKHRAPVQRQGFRRQFAMPELIARILSGERELFHELVRPYEKSVYFATFSILQNRTGR